MTMLSAKPLKCTYNASPRLLGMKKGLPSLLQMDINGSLTKLHCHMTALDIQFSTAVTNEHGK